MLLARYDNSPADTHYYHHDALGSTMGLTDTNKTVVKSYLYDDFGNLWDSWGNVDNHYLYTGQEYDDEIEGAELYNLRARYYSPGIGRFVSEDPMGFNIESPQMLNCYLYVLNNPFRYIDPTGRQEEECCYIIVFDEDKFWQCIKEWFWPTEPLGVGVCVGACIACAHGIEPACAVCALCGVGALAIVTYCLDVATSLEPVPGPCPPSPPLPVPRMHYPSIH